MKQRTKKNLDLISQTGTALIAVLLCLMAVLFFSRNIVQNKDPVAYPLDDSITAYDPYIQQFDALEKGQVYIDYEQDPRLDELENVYDYNERTKSGIFYLFDRAYYEGKYYCYFGITPILTVYYPYYLLTGSLPGTGTVMTVFAFIAAIFMPLAVIAWIWKFAPKTPHFVTLFAGPAVFWSSLIMLIARGRTPFYYIPCAAALAFFSVFVYLSIAAYSAGNRVARTVLYVLAGISFGLLFQARVVTAVAAAILVLPGLWFFIIGRERRGERRSKIIEILTELCALGIPVALFFTGSMIFNAMRFSGPLDFGSNYNLTIADTSTYKVRLSDLPFALYHYLGDFPAKSDTYPYISFSYVKFSNYGHYLYRDAGFGMLSVPLCWGIFASPALIFSHREKLSRKLMFSAASAACLIIPLLDFCLGGVIYRYLSDFSFIMSFFGMAALVVLCNRPRESTDALIESGGNLSSSSLISRRAASYQLYALLCVFLVFSIWASVRLFLINDNGNVMNYSEEVAAAIEKIVKYPLTVE